MRQLNIIWHKELKNCVPFYIYINGTQCGIIKRGESASFNLEGNLAEIYFVPKAPKWFGWRALKLQTELIGEICELHLAVQVSNDSVFGALGNAANINNQLHCTTAGGMNVNGMEYIKKYK